MTDVTDHTFALIMSRFDVLEDQFTRLEERLIDAMARLDRHIAEDTAVHELVHRNTSFVNAVLWFLGVITTASVSSWIWLYTHTLAGKP